MTGHEIVMVETDFIGTGHIADIPGPNELLVALHSNLRLRDLLVGD
jgi:hypothetical protein